MDYIGVKDAAERWGVTLRTVQKYCLDGRVPGAVKHGNNWLIPLSSQKPMDPRRARKLPPEQSPAYILHPSTPWPRDDPDAALLTLGEPFRSISAANLACYRGDFEPSKACWRNLRPGDPAMLTTALLSVSAAIGSGDYALYHEIQCALAKCKARTQDALTRELLSLPETLVAVNVNLPVMTPDWLKEGDFSIFPLRLRPLLLYLYALHLRNTRQHSASRAVARTTLALIERPDSFTWIEVYLHLICSVASYFLGEQQAARQELARALRLGMPHGFITPYAEYLTGYGGMLENMLAQEYPQYLKSTTALWKKTFSNWNSFRNQFTHENIATILSPQEQHAALLYARGMTSRQTAKALSLSESRVRSILSEVYSKLSISGKNELKRYLLTF